MGIFNKKQVGEELTFTIPDMHCDNCERRVRAIVDALPGIADAKANSGSGTLSVVLEAGSTTDEKAIREALAAGNYPAS